MNTVAEDKGGDRSMGRGLSEVQKTILRVALARRLERSEDQDSIWDADVSMCEILVAHWGWRPSEWATWIDGPQHHFKFDPDQIGRSKYDAARSALSRALVRLERRGLVERCYSKGGISAFYLTDAGVEVAKSLTVKIPAIDGILTVR